MDTASDGLGIGLNVGKAPAELLFATLGDAHADGLLQGPGLGRDAAIVEFGAQALVLTADPITFAGADAGRLAVTINANDVYAVGADPHWLLATVLSPPGVSEAGLTTLLSELRAACDEAGIALVGGHTEVTDAVSRTVVSCALVGSAPLSQIVYSDGARAGDLIVQAGRAAVEGTAILGHPELLDSPGVSIAAAARALRSVEGVHAMHDVTEGGVGTAAWELTAAAELGVVVEGDAILWLPETLLVCEAEAIEPLSLLGSGTLLAAVSPDAADAALIALDRAAVEATVIGRVTTERDATLRIGGRERPLPRVTRDAVLSASNPA